MKLLSICEAALMAIDVQNRDSATKTLEIKDHNDLPLHPPLVINSIDNFSTGTASAKFSLATDKVSACNNRLI
jgi:hypothetical protein